MNQNINNLFQIASKTSRKIIGLMSGTSLDGLDVAFCEISDFGEKTKVNLLNFETIDYSEDLKFEIRKVFAKKQINFQHLALLNEYIGNIHGEMILECLKKWNISAIEVDLIASHGQTVMHAPKILHQQEKFSNATLQIGDGDHIAVKTGIITISDFRQKHLASGGEGAPLAVYGDYFVFGQKGENRILLNMGGIANFTFLPSSLNPEEVFVTDTGTGNTLIDAFTRHYFPELSYDKNAEISKKGTINQELLLTLKNNDFFKKPFPKTTGPELFSKDYVFDAQISSNTNNINVNDLLATLTQFSAETITEAIKYAIKNSNNPNDNFTIYISGGGMHNPLLVETLKKLLPYKFKKTNDLGISGDAKEAVLFAILANENVAGGKSDFGTRKGIPSVSMGKISFPN
jgi:anhydro-N-acetylmuramic acid kinase